MGRSNTNFVKTLYWKLKKLLRVSDKKQQTFDAQNVGKSSCYWIVVDKNSAYSTYYVCKFIENSLVIIRNITYLLKSSYFNFTCY